MTDINISLEELAKNIAKSYVADIHSNLDELAKKIATKYATDINIDLDELAKKIAQIIVNKPPQPAPYLLSSADVCRMLGYAYHSSAARKVFADPGFPAPVELIEGGHLRWKRTDIEHFVEKKMAENYAVPFAVDLGIKRFTKR